MPVVIRACPVNVWRSDRYPDDVPVHCRKAVAAMVEALKCVPSEQALASLTSPAAAGSERVSTAAVGTLVITQLVRCGHLQFSAASACR